MAITGWRVIARDPNLRRRGYLPFTKLTLDHRHQVVSTWTLELQATRSVRKRLGPGWGIIILRDGVEILSGPLDDDGPRTWSASDDGEIGTITVTGSDDLEIVAGELAYPDPTVTAADQTGGPANDVRTGPAETVIKGYVADNVGITRAAARGDADAPDVRLVTVAEDLARGDTVQFTARFQSLTDIARTIAQAGSANLGFEAVHDVTTDEIVFDVYVPRDQRRKLRFSRDTGNLSSASTTDSMPTLTHAVVLGQIPVSDTEADETDDPSKQPIVERADSAVAEAWRMIVRQVVDSSSTSDATEMAQAGDAALTEGKRQYATDVVVTETAQVRYPATVGRGDIITVIDPNLDGRTVVDAISNVHVEITTGDDGKEEIRFDVGTTDATSSTDDLVNLVKILKRQVQALQRRT